MTNQKLIKHVTKQNDTGPYTGGQQKYLHSVYLLNSSDPNFGTYINKGVPCCVT